MLNLGSLTYPGCRGNGLLCQVHGAVGGYSLSHPSIWRDLWNELSEQQREFSILSMAAISSYVIQLAGELLLLTP